MSKMREAWERWDKLLPHERNSQVSFNAGYAAAIADVKAGGASGFLYQWDKGEDIWKNELHGETLFDFIPIPHTRTPLYKLPEDV